MLPAWQLTPLEIDSAKEASRAIKPFDGKPDQWEMFSDDLVAYASFVKLKDEFLGNKSFPTEKDVLDGDEEVVLNFSRTRAETKRDASVPLDTDLDWEDESTQNDASTTRSHFSTITREQLQYMRSNLKCIFAVLRKCIKDSPTVMSIANKDGAMKREDPIAAYKNLREEYVSSSGLGILAVVEELVTIHEEQSSDVNEAISRIEKCIQRLADRGVDIQSVLPLLPIAVLMKCVKDKQLRTDLNITVSKEIVERGHENLSWSRVVELIRLYLANQRSFSHRSSSSKQRQSDSTKASSDEGSKAFVGTKQQRPRCPNCGNPNHTVDVCRGGCRTCDTFSHAAKDCPRRQGNTAVPATSAAPPSSPSQLSSTPSATKQKKKKGHKASKGTSSQDDADVQDEYHTYFASSKTVLAATKGPRALRAQSSATAYVDSGCNGIFIHNRKSFLHYAPTTSTATPVIVGNGHSCDIKGVGTVNIGYGTLQADYVPDFSQSLLGVSILTQASSDSTTPNVAIFEHDKMRLLPITPALRRSLDDIYETSITLLEAPNRDGLYETTLPVVKQACAGYRYKSAHFQDLPSLVLFLHRAWGHPSLEQMIAIMRSNTHGDIPDGVTESAVRKYYPNPCAECIIGTMAQKPLPGLSATEAHKPGDIVQIDIKGPLTDDDGQPILTFSGYKAYVCAVDKFSKMRYVYLIRNNKRLHRVVNKIILAYTQKGHTIKIFQTDSQFITEGIKDLCAENKVELQRCAPHEHGQLGLVERTHRTLMGDVIKAMANKPHISPKMWGMALHDCVFKRNAVIVDHADQKSSWELFEGKPFDFKLHPIFPFGTVLLAHIPTKHQSGIGPRAREVYYVGPATDVKGGVQLYVPKTHRVIIRRTFKYVGDNPIPPVLDQLDLVATLSADDVNTDLEEPLVDLANTSVDPSENDVAITTTTIPFVNDDRCDVESDTSLSDHESFSAQPKPNKLIAAPKKQRLRTKGKKRLSNKKRSPSKPSLDNPYQRFYPLKQAHIAKPTEFIPSSVNQALHCDEKEGYMKAIKEELASMLSTGTLVPTKIPSDQIPKTQILPSKFVFAKRYNADGSFKKYRARLVGRGDLQPWDSYSETYAGTATTKSVHMFLAIAAELDLELKAIDVSSAFLYPAYNGPTLFVRRPPGLPANDMPEYMQLKKCIYGIKQAAHAFREHSDASLKSIGFTPTRADPCIYINRKSASEFVMACIHVDDIGFAGTSTAIVDQTIADLSKLYDLTVQPDMSSYLGMNISRDRTDRTMYVSQPGYIDTILQRFEVDYCKSPTTPMSVTYHSARPTDSEPLSISDVQRYQSIVGSLMYLAIHTRPDLLYSVTSLARHGKTPIAYDLSAAIRVLRYLKSTRDLALKFHSGEGIVLYASVDASYACHLEDRKSHTGYTLHIGRTSGCFFAASRKQTVTAQSSTEAEFIGTNSVARDVVWCRMLLEELGFPQQGPTVVFEDNKSTIELLSSAKYHAKTKHIEVRYFYVKDQLASGILTFQYQPTVAMVSDVLTKPLPGELFHRHSSTLLGMDNE